MSTTASLSSVLSGLFTAPLNAATQAEADYRTIWAEWLEKKLAKFDEADRANVTFDQLFTECPVVDVSGRVDLSLSMRIASVSEKGGQAGAGLQLGPVHAGGSFNFMSRESEESLFRAAASFTVTNTGGDLRKLLEDANISMDDGKVDEAIKFLGNKKA